MALNLTVTAGQALSHDYNSGGASVNDKMLLVIYNNGSPVVTKKSSSIGGSTDEIAIVESTKYTLKLKAADTLKLPGSGVTCKLFKITGEDSVTEVDSGTVTVNSAVAVEVFTSGSVPSYRYTQKFSANDALDVQIPAGAILTNIICEEKAGETMTLNVGVSSLGTTVVNGASISANDLKPLTIADPLFSKVSPQTLYVNSESWGDCEVVLTFIWQLFI